MKLKYSLVGLLLGISSTVSANNVTDTLGAGESPNVGDILWYSGVSGNTAGTWSAPSSIPGLNGGQGPQGEQGLQGETGATGATGAQGDKGDTGATGAKGEIDQATLDTINTNHTTEVNNRISADTNLQQNINNEMTQRITQDEILQRNLNVTNTRVDALDSRVDSLENEVHKLGETKYILGGSVRVFDSRKFQVNVFDNFNARRGHNDAVGLTVGYKLGKSYEEKMIEQQGKAPSVTSLMAFVEKQAHALEAQQATIHTMQSDMKKFHLKDVK